MTKKTSSTTLRVSGEDIFLVTPLLWKDTTPEEQDDIIKKTVKILEKYGMEVPAILFLGTIKPLAYLGGQLGRYFLGPLLPFMGEREEAFIQTFEQHGNIEKLIKMLEEGKKEEKTRKDEKEKGSGEETHKSWWKRLFSF